MPTQAKFWHRDKTMDFSKLSQFGLTCAVANYMHSQLYKVSGDAQMMPFMRTQAEKLIDGCDVAIKQTHKQGKKLGLLK
jgi:hypothetical protein